MPSVVKYSKDFKPALFNDWRRILLLNIILLCFGFHSKSQQSILKGFITDSFNQGIRRASIENLKSGARTFSNDKGAFMLTCSEGDTLKISHIGYQSFRIRINKNDFTNRITIQLQPIAYHLPEARVRRKSDSLALRYAHKMKSDSLLNDFKRYTQFPAKPKLEFSSGLVLEGLITSIWYKLSDKGKEMEKLKRLQGLYQQEMRADERFSLQFIQQICACPADSAAIIRQTCKPPSSFILTKSDYELAIFLKSCQTKYNAVQPNSSGLPKIETPGLSPTK